MSLLQLSALHFCSCSKLMARGLIESKYFAYSTINRLPQDVSMNVFDRNTKLLQKERAASLPDCHVYDYLKEEIGYRLSDRIFDIKRKFKCAVDLGCNRGYVAKHISSDSVEKLILCDSSSAQLAQVCLPEEGVIVERLVVDEENLPFEEESVDLVVSNLSLHWVNDLPGTLSQIKRCLVKDGAFLATIFGGDTLYELRCSLQLAELERKGGISPHISPFTQIRDIGSLLNRAGFTLLTIDTEEITVGYPSMFELMTDLKGMGESNAAWNRCAHLSRDVMFAASAIYENLYGKDDKIPATFQIIYLVGWKPHPKQPKPIERGSGKISFKDLHKLDEITKDLGKINLDEEEKK